MFLTAKTRPVNEFDQNKLSLLINRINQLALELTTLFSIAVWDYSYCGNELVQMLGAHPAEDGTYLSDLERVFPSISGKAKRLFEQASRDERVGISPLDPNGNRSFVIIVTPDNLMLFGAKSDSYATNHAIIEAMVEEVVNIRDNIPSLRRERLKIVEFKPVTTIRNNYSLAALS